MTPTPIIRTFPDTGKNTVEIAMVLRRAWLGSVGVIVISRKSEYRRRSANARGVFDKKYLFRYAPAEFRQCLLGGSGRCPGFPFLDRCAWSPVVSHHP